MSYEKLRGALWFCDIALQLQPMWRYSHCSYRSSNDRWIIASNLQKYSFLFPYSNFLAVHGRRETSPVITHCKEKIPKFRNKYSQNRNTGVIVPISSYMRLWVIYIFPRSVCLFCWRKYICRPILGLYKSLTDTWMWNEAALFPEEEYISGIFVSVQVQ